MAKFEPFGDFMVVRPCEDEEKRLIEVVGDEGVDLYPGGIVIAMGPGARGPEGGLVPMPCGVGDKVIYNRRAAFPLKVAGEGNVVIKASQLLGRAKKG